MSGATRGSPAGARQIGAQSRVLRVAGLAGLLALLGVILWLLTAPEVRAGTGYVDTDDYTRLMRVRSLVEGGGWFDSSVPRSNWPDGDTLHWTRPVDAVLVAAAVAAAPVLGQDLALHWAAILVPPLLLLAIIAAVAWAGAALVGRLSWVVAPAFMLVQPAVLLYGRPGRPDHHALILLCFALAVGFLLRGIREPGRRGWAAGLGVAVGVGMWISPEFLLPMGILLLAGLGLWVVDDGDRGEFQLRWTAWTTVTMSLALVVERGSGLLVVEYDRISVVHVLVGVLATGVSAAAVWRQRTGADHLRTRLAVGAVAGVAALALMGAVFPRFFGGPMVDVTDPVARMWLGRVGELQPILLPVDLRAFGLLVLNAGAALVAIPVLARRMAHRGEEARPAGFLLGALGVCVSLAVLQFRWTTYVQLLAAPAVLMVVRAWGGGASAPPSPRTRVRTAVVALGLILGPLVVGGVLVGLGGTDAPTDSVPVASCDYEALAAFLDAEPRWESPQLVAAHMDLGPVLLYRTRHRVWATPYHRNQAGIRKAYDLFTETDAEAALRRARTGRPDLLVICPGRDEGIFPRVMDGDTTLFGRLVTGPPPAWLEEVTTPEALAPARIFQVRLPDG